MTVLKLWQAGLAWDLSVPKATHAVRIQGWAEWQGRRRGAAGVLTTSQAACEPAPVPVCSHGSHLLPHKHSLSSGSSRELHDSKSEVISRKQILPREVKDKSKIKSNTRSFPARCTKKRIWNNSMIFKKKKCSCKTYLRREMWFLRTCWVIVWLSFSDLELTIPKKSFMPLWLSSSSVKWDKTAICFLNDAQAYHVKLWGKSVLFKTIFLCKRENLALAD